MKVANNTVLFACKLGSDELRADVSAMTGKHYDARPLIVKTNRGFTLVELLIALFVFSLLSAFSYRAVNQLSDTGANVAAQADAMGAVQKAMRLWEGDVQKIIIRPKPADSGDSLSSDLSDEGSIEFPVMVESSRQDYHATDVKWVRYSLKEGVLFRDVWNQQDQDKEEPSVSMPILTDVTALDFASQGLDGAVSENGSSALPPSISISLQHKSLGAVKRVFYVGAREPDKDFSSLINSQAGANGLSDEDARLCPGATRC